MIQIESVAEPLSLDPDVALAAARLVARGEYLGLLPETGAGSPLRLDGSLLETIFRRLVDEGVGRDALVLLQRARTADDFRRALDLAMEEIQQSPVPSLEWPRLIETLGEGVLSQLVGTSVSSIRRYATGRRATPDDVASRLHFVALLVSDLSGAYNAYGVRRWFGRRRTLLEGRPAAELLGGHFDPDGGDADLLRQLVGSLAASGAT